MRHDHVVILDQQFPEGLWEPWMGPMNLRGSGYTAKSVNDFVAAARSEPSFARIDRESGNPHDANALAVLGVAGNSSWHLGYIPKATAAKIARFHHTMPIAARILHVRFVGWRIFVNAQIFLPPPNARKSYAF